MHSQPEKSKVTRYESAMQVKKQLGKDPIELQLAPGLPEECRHLWAVFTRLCSVSYQEIHAYTELTGDILSTWEIDAIIGMNNARLSPPERFIWFKQQA